MWKEIYKKFWSRRMRFPQNSRGCPRKVAVTPKKITETGVILERNARTSGFGVPEATCNFYRGERPAKGITEPDFGATNKDT